MAIETDNQTINWIVSEAAATEVKNACIKLDPLEEDVLDLENQTGECGWYYSPIKVVIETTNDSPMALENDPSTKMGFSEYVPEWDPDAFKDLILVIFNIRS